MLPEALQSDIKAIVQNLHAVKGPSHACAVDMMVIATVLRSFPRVMRASVDSDREDEVTEAFEHALSSLIVKALQAAEFTPEQATDIMGDAGMINRRIDEHFDAIEGRN